MGLTVRSNLLYSSQYGVYVTLKCMDFEQVINRVRTLDLARSRSDPSSLNNAH